MKEEIIKSILLMCVVKKNNNNINYENIDFNSNKILLR